MGIDKNMTEGIRFIGQPKGAQVDAYMRLRVTDATVLNVCRPHGRLTNTT